MYTSILLHIQNTGVSVTFFVIAIFMAILLTFIGTILITYSTEKKIIIKLQQKGLADLGPSKEEITSQQGLHKRKGIEIRKRTTRDLFNDI